MRLFTKYSRVSIMASVLALLIGSVGYYFAVRFVLVHELDDAIRIEEEEILDNVARHGALPKPANYRDQQIAYVPAQQPEERRFVNTNWADLESELGNALKFSDTTEESALPSQRPGGRHIRRRDPDDPCRALIFSVQVGHQYYTTFVSKSEEE